MKRRTIFFCVSWVLLGGWIGCTPAGAPPEEESFSLEAPAVESPATAPATPETPVAAAPDAEPEAPAAEPEAPAQQPAAPGEERTIALGENLTMTAPEHWVRKQPAMQMIAYEFAVPAAEGDEAQGRVTVMTAGGSVEANIERWIGQFSQPDGTATKDRAKVEKKSIAGREVHLVDLRGTYQDARGPFAPAVERPGYRMLAAIIPTSEGTYFVKFYGPEKTVSENQEAFARMIEGLK